jgi:hypothetical protein
LQAKNKDLREQQEVVNNRVATTNAKNLNANRKLAEAPKIVEANKTTFQNRLIAMGGNV